MARRAQQRQSGRLTSESQVGGGKDEEERDGGREAQHQRLPRPRAVEEACAAADGPQAFPFRSLEDDDADHGHRQDEVRDQHTLVHGNLLRSNSPAIVLCPPCARQDPGAYPPPAAAPTMAAKAGGSRLAPPTRAPSISGWVMNSPMFSGVTLPPSSMRVSCAPSPNRSAGRPRLRPPSRVA